MSLLCEQHGKCETCVNNVCQIMTKIINDLNKELRQLPEEFKELKQLLEIVQFENGELTELKYKWRQEISKVQGMIFNFQEFIRPLVKEEIENEKKIKFMQTGKWE